MTQSFNIKTKTLALRLSS